MPGERRGRRHVDDVAVALEQRGDGGPAAQERAGEVHGEHLIPHLERVLVRVGGAQDAGHVGEHIEPAVPFDGVGDQRLDECGIAHVADRFGETVLRDVDGDDGGALFGQPLDGGAADARRRAGHDRHPSLESAHRLRLERVLVSGERVNGYLPAMTYEPPGGPPPPPQQPWQPPPVGAPYPASAYGTPGYGYPAPAQAKPLKGLATAITVLLVLTGLCAIWLAVALFHRASVVSDFSEFGAVSASRPEGRRQIR